MLTDVIVVVTSVALPVVTPHICKKTVGKLFTEVMNQVGSQIIFSTSYRHVNFSFKPVEFPLAGWYKECWLKALYRPGRSIRIQYSLWTKREQFKSTDFPLLDCFI